MRRKIYYKLLEWKDEEKGKVALLIDRDCRVGKSYVVEEFGKNKYKLF